MKVLATIMADLFNLPCAHTSHLSAVTARDVYRDLVVIPCPKVEAKFPGVCWPLVWRRLATRGLSPELVDTAF
jgi:hypothetical protein